MNQQSRERGRSWKLSRLGLTIAVGLLILVIGVQGVRTTHPGPQETISAVFMLPPLVLIPFVAVGRRWTAAVAAALAAFYAIGATQTEGEMSFLTHPAPTVAFGAIVAEMVAAVIVVASGIAATVPQLPRGTS